MNNEELIISKKKIQKIYLEKLIILNKDKIDNQPNKEMKDKFMSRIRNYSRNCVHKLISTSYGFQSSDLNIIFLHLKDIYDKQEYRNKTQHPNKSYTYDELLCETYTHEVIHSLIEELIDYQTSQKYDNINKKALRHYDIMG